jgi:hypothetical protein
MPRWHAQRCSKQQTDIPPILMGQMPESGHEMDDRLAFSRGEAS